MLRRVTDIVISFFCLLVLIPLIVFITVLSLSDRGSLIYSQERIGKNGIPFIIYKFRSMRGSPDIEKPALSSPFDSRITPFGKIMRKYRMDEIPNFINVIKGDMSIIGPRPERQYYITQIMEQFPQYAEIQSIRPGITSWGQVKAGYASNVEEMVKRAKYDLYYMKHRSFLFDLKILALTITTIFQGKGL